VRVYRPGAIHLAGYSQGAAHATLALRDTLYHFPGLTLSCTAFASPRVYGAKGAIEFGDATGRGRNATLTRYVLDGDPVPDLPPWWIGYRHVGTLVTLGSGGLDPMKHDPARYDAALKGATP